jgi:predicted DNA-binding transcriptional regulator AlpA
MTDRVMRSKEVAKLLSVSRATIWRWYTIGHFPAPINLGPTQGAKGCHGWRESDVLAWLDARPTLDLTRGGQAT